jgi:hypothetical protein
MRKVETGGFRVHFCVSLWRLGASLRRRLPVTMIMAMLLLFPWSFVEHVAELFVANLAATVRVHGLRQVAKLPVREMQTELLQLYKHRK